MNRVAAFAVLVALALLTIGQVAARADEPNQPPAGFTPLFNGRDLSGWKDAEKQAEFWKVEDGVLHWVGKGGRDLATAEDFRDFELWLDWRLDPAGGDSGIFLRGRQQAQVQIWDVKEGSGGLLHNAKGSPGQRPSVVADHKLGEWNTFWIKMVDKRVTVQLNGQLVVDNCELQDDKTPAAGPLVLEAHRGALSFRNVYVRPLDAP
jgi:hypothetical protein